MEMKGRDSVGEERRGGLAAEEVNDELFVGGKEVETWWEIAVAMSTSIWVHILLVDWFEDRREERRGEERL